MPPKKMPAKGKKAPPKATSQPTKKAAPKKEVVAVPKKKEEVVIEEKVEVVVVEEKVEAKVDMIEEAVKDNSIPEKKRYVLKEKR